MPWTECRAVPGFPSAQAWDVVKPKVPAAQSPEVEATPESGIHVSVVIPSKNSPQLNASLQSVATAASQQPRHRVEVIIVDSSKTPPKILNEVRSRIHVTVISEDCGLLAARLEGIKRARGTWILNLDSDQLVHPRLFKTITQAQRPAIIFPEVPPGPATRWSRFVHRVHELEAAAFRTRPSTSIPCIPRAYRGGMLQQAVRAILRDLGNHSTTGIPTRHEDTILFSYFLWTSGLSISDAVDFGQVPIYHPVPPIEEVARKTFHYGIDLGRESKLHREGQLPINHRIWRSVYRVDLSPFRFWLPGLGLNICGMIYDLFRACFYLPGVLLGYFKVGGWDDYY
jgi:glycosyltransferase involved in cell wall biosynthesis